jgi:uncharacterized protein (UPF0261 family)
MTAARGKTILLIGAFDTKGEEYAFVTNLIEGRGHRVLTVDTGVMREPAHLTADIAAAQVAEAAGESLATLRAGDDRGRAMTVMSQGAARLVRELFDAGRFDGILGMGGTGGTSVIGAAMRALPVGVPKVLVSTAASGDTRPFLGTRDITLIPSVVDVAGINRISRLVFTEAAGAVCGMVEMHSEERAEERPVITVSMFGNTTQCVDRCRERLTADGYEVLVFHCTGTGGRTMEDLVADGLVTAVLDITTTEWADELCGGVFSAGPTRLEAPGRAGIPHLIVPGCVDMVNFGPRETVPAQYRDRLLYVWNPTVTLMRTTPQENAALGGIFAEKANQAGGPVAFLLPLQGVSILDSPGHEFWWPDADRAMFDALKANLRPGITVEEMDANINDPAFADRAVEMLLALSKKREVV